MVTLKVNDIILFLLSWKQKNTNTNKQTRRKKVSWASRRIQPCRLSRKEKESKTAGSTWLSAYMQHGSRNGDSRTSRDAPAALHTLSRDYEPEPSVTTLDIIIRQIARGETWVNIQVSRRDHIFISTMGRKTPPCSEYFSSSAYLPS